MGLKEILAAKAASALAAAPAAPPENTTVTQPGEGNQETGIQSDLSIQDAPTVAPAPPPLDHTPEGIDYSKPVRFKAGAIRRYAVDGWLEAQADGYFYPKTKRQLKTLSVESKKGNVIPENF